LALHKTVECSICKQKLEEIQGFDIRLYHVWKEHKEIVVNTEKDIAVNTDTEIYKDIFSEM
jgi:hypothetical protein